MVSHTGDESSTRVFKNDASKDTSIYDGADTFRLNKSAYRKASQSELAM